MSQLAQTVQGTVTRGFEPVARAFESNFSQRNELGAACAIYHKGKKVVDLWGGIRDKRSGAAWEENTIVPVFSTTKGMASMAVAHAHSHGLIDFDARVADYWPAFAQNGKADVTVRQLISHQAGLCAIDEKIDMDVMSDPERLSAAIAKQTPIWEPGRKHGYHGITLGWYESELIRHADPQKRTIGRYFQDEIATPLGLDFFIGLPNDIPRERIATIDGYAPWKMVLNLNKMPWAFTKNFLRPGSIAQRSFSNPAYLGKINNYNDPKLQAIELPAANGIGDARSIAKAYGEFATGGTSLGLKAETLDELHRPAQMPSDGLNDQVLGIDTVFSLGYVKPFADLEFSPSGKAFGTPGAGGSFGFADPEAELGFAYVMNRSGFYLWDDPREKVIRDAMYACVDALQ